ncbi:hypothetical protein [Streptomyces sp. NPDC057682]|uniref:hypothetical protein n=1 Tax=Streptomyces sp. NPDC057682 TaxID=3346210 RepID=UPI0036C9340E
MDTLDTIGAVFVAVIGVGCALWGGRCLLRPASAPQDFQGSAWAARSWGGAYFVIGVCQTIRMIAKLYGREPTWPMDVSLAVATPLLGAAFLGAYVSRRRARRDGTLTRPGRHSRARLLFGGRRA